MPTGSLVFSKNQKTCNGRVDRLRAISQSTKRHHRRQPETHQHAKRALNVDPSSFTGQIEDAMMALRTGAQSFDVKKSNWGTKFWQRLEAFRLARVLAHKWPRRHETRFHEIADTMTSPCAVRFLTGWHQTRWTRPGCGIHGPRTFHAPTKIFSRT